MKPNFFTFFFSSFVMLLPVYIVFFIFENIYIKIVTFCYLMFLLFICIKSMYMHNMDVNKR